MFKRRLWNCWLALALTVRVSDLYSTFVNSIDANEIIDNFTFVREYFESWVPEQFINTNYLSGNVNSLHSETTHFVTVSYGKLFFVMDPCKTLLLWVSKSRKKCAYSINTILTTKQTISHGHGEQSYHKILLWIVNPYLTFDIIWTIFHIVSLKVCLSKLPDILSLFSLYMIFYFKAIVFGHSVFENRTNDGQVRSL